MATPATGIAFPPQSQVKCPKFRQLRFHENPHYLCYFSEVLSMLTYAKLIAKEVTPMIFSSALSLAICEPAPSLPNNFTASKRKLITR